MLLHDAAGSIVVVSAESVKMAGEGCLVLNARAVYIHNQALTPEQAAIVKRGVMTTLDDPAALEYLHGKHDVTGVELAVNGKEPSDERHSQTCGQEKQSTFLRADR